MKRVPVAPVACEAIFKSDPSKPPTEIRYATTITTTLREPKANGRVVEKFHKIEYAEIPNMSEPVIVGCPVWDGLSVYPTRSTIEVSALNIRSPTIMQNGHSSGAGQCLRLATEAEVVGDGHMKELACELKVTNDSVARHLRSLTTPWIRAGPNCPSDIDIVEGLVRPRFPLQSTKPVPMRVFAYQ